MSEWTDDEIGADEDEIAMEQASAAIAGACEYTDAEIAAMRAAFVESLRESLRHNTINAVNLGDWTFDHAMRSALSAVRCVPEECWIAPNDQDIGWFRDVGAKIGVEPNSLRNAYLAMRDAYRGTK